MAKYLFLVIIAALGLTLSSCYSHNWDTLHPQACLVVDTGTVISYSANIVPIVRAKCSVSGCHTAGAVSSATTPGDYTTYAGFDAFCAGDTTKAKAWQDITGQSGNPMPQQGSPQLTPCEKATLRNWIHQGALNN